MFNIGDKVKNKNNGNTGVVVGYDVNLILIKIDQFNYSVMNTDYSYCVESDWVNI